MKNQKISSRYLNKCIRIIESNCTISSSGAFYGSSLEKFCSNPRNIYAINILEASGEIRTDSTDSNERPNVIWLENKGILHRYVTREKCISSVKSYFAGILSTIIATQLVPFLIEVLCMLIQQAAR